MRLFSIYYKVNTEEIYRPIRDHIPVETKMRYQPSPVGTK